MRSTNTIESALPNCIFRCSLTTVGWTGLGRKIQTLSNLRPESVQMCPGSVQMYKVCPVPVHSSPVSVKALSNHEALGQTVDMKIQIASRLKVWTIFRHGQTLDRGQIFYNKRDTPSHGGQSYDKLWTWTDLGQSLDFHNSTYKSKLCPYSVQIEN